MGKIRMNDGYILVKKDNSLKKIDGLTMLDGAGNCQKGIVVECTEGSKFDSGKTVFFRGGVKVVVESNEFLVVKNEDVYFQVE